MAHIGLRVSTNFSLKVSAQLWPKNLYKKNQQYS